MHSFLGSFPLCAPNNQYFRNSIHFSRFSKCFLSQPIRSLKLHSLLLSAWVNFIRELSFSLCFRLFHDQQQKPLHSFNKYYLSLSCVPGTTASISAKVSHLRLKTSFPKLLNILNEKNYLKSSRIAQLAEILSFLKNRYTSFYQII